MTWLLSEDEALKTHLGGMTVNDLNRSSRKVGVWFAAPEKELREQSYPYLTIAMIDLYEDTTRSARGVVTLPYVPDGTDPAPGEVLLWDYPIPYNLVYQVTTYARHPRHDRQLLADLLRYKVSKYSSLYISADDTVRSMFLQDVVSRGPRIEDGRTLYSSAITLSVASELTMKDARRVQEVLAVSLTMNKTDPYYGI